MEPVEIDALGSMLEVLTALIAPAVLLSVCGTFISSTATRLGRNSDRVRFLLERIRAPPESDHEAQGASRRRLDQQLRRTYRRVTVEQRALLLFYASAALIVACSLSLGLKVLVRAIPDSAPIVLGLAGVTLLLIGSTLLMIDTRLVVRGLKEEVAGVLWPRRHSVHVSTGPKG